MKIGELAKKTGTSAQTIRYYEKENLLVTNQRSEGNYRLYGALAVSQLLFIKRCRTLDLSISEIKQLLDYQRSPDSQCDDINQMIDRHLHDVDQRIEELKSLKNELTDIQKSCTGGRTIDQCGVLKNLTDQP